MEYLEFTLEAVPASGLKPTTLDPDPQPHQTQVAKPSAAWRLE